MGEKKCLVPKLFWHQIYDSLWGEEKITTWTYLKFLASPVSFVARNLYSVELTVYGPNIPWLYQFYAGRLQRFFLKEKEKTAPARNELLWAECNNCWDSQQCTGNCRLPTVRNEKDNPYTTSLWYMTHTMLVSSQIYNTFYFFLWECKLYRQPVFMSPERMNGQLPEIEYPAEWPEMPCPAFWKSPTGHVSWWVIHPMTIRLA